MIKIGEFSKLSRVSIRMLRHYDEMGLLKPVYIDPDSGYRYYSEDQLSAVGRITALKDMGFALSEITQLMLCCEDRQQIEHALVMKISELQQEYQRLGYRMQLLDTALERARKDEPMQYDVTLKTFPERYAASVRKILPSYEQEGSLWAVLMEETAPLHLVDDVPCYCCAVFHDQEYKESNVDVEVYKTVRGVCPDTENVRFRKLPAITVASAVCKGAYDQMGAAMSAIAQWVISNGYSFEGPAFNIYHVSPHETKDPDSFVTEVCYPVSKKPTEI